MVNILRVLIYEINRTIRRRGFLFTTFGLPLLLFAFTFLWRAISPSPDEMVQQVQTLATSFDGIGRAGIVDLSGEFASAAGSDILMFADEESALAALDREELDAVYVIPADYAETREARQIIPRMALDDISTTPLTALAARTLQAEVSESQLMRLQNPANFVQVDLTKFDEDGNLIEDNMTESQREDANFSLVYLFAMLFVLTTFTGSGYLMQSVIEEKENRLIEVLITTVRPAQLLAGKVLAGGLMALFQVATWAVIGIVLMRLQGDFLTQMIPFLAAIAIPTANLGVIAAYFLIGFFMFAALFGMVGALSSSTQEGPQMSVLFILPAMIPLWAAPALLAEPNGTLAVLLSMFPITAPIGMISRLVLTEVPALEIALSLGIMFVTTVGLYWLAGRLFRVQILLSGKMPRIRDIPGLIFSRA